MPAAATTDLVLDPTLKHKQAPIVIIFAHLADVYTILSIPDGNESCSVLDLTLSPTPSLSSLYTIWDRRCMHTMHYSHFVGLYTTRGPRLEKLAVAQIRRLNPFERTYTHTRAHLCN